MSDCDFYDCSNGSDGNDRLRNQYFLQHNNYINYSWYEVTVSFHFLIRTVFGVFQMSCNKSQPFCDVVSKYSFPGSCRYEYAPITKLWHSRALTQILKETKYIIYIFKPTYNQNRVDYKVLLNVEDQISSVSRYSGNRL
jgi:hypothetical protein